MPVPERIPPHFPLHTSATAGVRQRRCARTGREGGDRTRAAGGAEVWTRRMPGVWGAPSGSSGALSLSLSLFVSLSLSSLTRSDDKNSGRATTLVVDHSDVLHHYQGCWSDVTACWAYQERLWCGSRMIGIAGGDGHGSFCFDELTAGKGRGGGKVMCEQYGVVGREQDVAGALQTWQLVLYHPVVAPATLYPSRVVILEQRAWICDPRQG